MTFEDEEAQQAIRDAIASDNSGAMLAKANGMEFTGDEIDMKPESIDGTVAPDPMDETLALADAPPPMQWRTVHEAPSVAPQGDISAMPRPQMAMSGDSDVTMRQRNSSQDSGGGFDWARAFFAAGNGDLAAFDANRARREEAPYKRAAALQEQMDRDQARALAKAAMDPNSQESRAKQAEYANEMQARSQMMAASGMNDLAATFAEEAKRAGTMSASQIDRSQFGKVFGDALKFSDIQAKREALPAKQAMEERKVAAAELQAKNTGAQGWARINEAKEEHKLRHEELNASKEEKKTAAAEKLANELPGAGEVGKYNERIVAEGQIKRAMELLPKIRYAGWGAEGMASLMSKDPTGVLPKATKEEQEFIGILKDLRAHARNKIFGAALSKYDISDAETFLASLGTNKETIQANLDRLGKATADQNRADEDYYPGLINRRKKKDGVAASTASSAPVDPRIELAKKALADQNASPEHKAAAKRILGIK